MLTVEEARKKITDLVIAVTHDRPYSRLPLDACFNDLILAVQASMPCSQSNCCVGVEQHPTCIEDGEQFRPPCPSCTARRTLQERETGAGVNRYPALEPDGYVKHVFYPGWHFATNPDPTAQKWARNGENCAICGLSPHACHAMNYLRPPGATVSGSR